MRYVLLNSWHWVCCGFPDDPEHPYWLYWYLQMQIEEDDNWQPNTIEVETYNKEEPTGEPIPDYTQDGPDSEL